MVDAISRCGGVFFVSPQGRVLGRHRHPELECNLVVRGTARYVAGSRRYDLAAGSLLWLFPGQEHALVQQSADLQLWLAFFHAPVLEQAQLTGAYRTLRERDPTGYHCRTLSEKARRQLRVLMELIAGHQHDQPHQRGPDEVRLAAGLAYLAVVAWALHGQASEPAVETVHPAVSQAARLLAEDARVTLTQVAATAGVSPSRLRHLFHEQTGSTLVAYRNRQRLQRFLDHHSSRRSLLEESLAAGFGSYAQFHRVFRALMGTSPQGWLRERA